MRLSFERPPSCNMRVKASNHFNPTVAVRRGEELDWPALDRCLRAAIPGLSGQAGISQYPSGNSNLTYRLKYANDDLVVRRPPFGTKAHSAHNMAREYRVMNALRGVFPSVPETLFYSDDANIIGDEFYVMRRVDGQLVNACSLPCDWKMSSAETAQFCRSFWGKLVELHRVDYRQAGLEEFGKPSGYAQRQVKGWNGRFQNARTPDVDDFADVQAWLEVSMPRRSDRVSVLHGDYRIDNVVLDIADPCKILAVLDWEISALGDPLMDLGNALAYWIQADDPPYLKALQLQPSSEPGMLSRAEILDFYLEKTGFEVSDFTFYYLYGMFRNTVILQQIYYRYFHGQTKDQRFSRFGEIAQSLGDHCRLLIAGKA